MPTIYIFECNDETEGECFECGLFGTKAAWPLQRVHTGDLCFLFNFYGRKRLIYGVYQATCDAKRNIVPEAWRGSGSSGFPNQVKVHQCSRERIAVPQVNIERIVTDPSTGRVRNILFGDQAQKLLDYFAGGYAFGRTAGSEMDKLEEDFRRRYPKEFHCSGGIDVRSKGELLIAEWLSAQRVYYDYERLANVPEHLVPDFTVYANDGHPVFMELWGMLDNPDYQQRRLRKCEVYHRHQCELIELYDDDIRNLDFCLRAKLKAHNVSFT
jgi:hypothetical protein